LLDIRIPKVAPGPSTSCNEDGKSVRRKVLGPNYLDTKNSQMRTSARSVVGALVLALPGIDSLRYVFGKLTCMLASLESEESLRGCAHRAATGDAADGREEGETSHGEGDPLDSGDGRPPGVVLIKRSPLSFTHSLRLSHAYAHGTGASLKPSVKRTRQKLASFFQVDLLSNHLLTKGQEPRESKSTIQ